MQIAYQASKTGSKFHQSDKLVRGFMGCVGNGKSVTCIQEGLRLSMDQWPNKDGIRKSRAAIIRNTAPELRTTTLNTWKQWIPEQIAPVVMHPIIHTTLRQGLGDGTAIELEVYFLALDKPEDVKKLLSMELTWAFLNEARELPYAVVKGARERIGRYPSKIDGYYDDGDYKAPRGPDGQIEPCKRKALLMDTNPPDTDHWWYQLAEEGHLKKSKNKALARKQTAEIFDFFRGVPPLIKQDDGTYLPNPEAENIENLPGGYQYYLDMIAGNTDDHINVQVLGNYGVIMDGKPVYPKYNDRFHCSNITMMPDPSYPICLGWDFGLTPACIIGQQVESGQIRIIKELVSDDMNVRQFARDVVKPFLQQHFHGYHIGFSLGDPAGDNRGEGEGKTSIGILNDLYVDNEFDDIIQPLNMGFTTQGAPTNDITKRLDAVGSLLIRLVGDAEPALIVNRGCQMIRKGFQGGYQYKRIQVGGSEEKFRETPDKNKFSHPHDALQYLCLGFVGGYVTDMIDHDEYDDMQIESTASYW